MRSWLGALATVLTGVAVVSANDIVVYSNDYSTTDGITTRANVSDPYLGEGGVLADANGGFYSVMDLDFGQTETGLDIRNGEFTITLRWDGDTPPDFDVTFWVRIYEGEWNGSGWDFSGARNYSFLVEPNAGWQTFTRKIDAADENDWIQPFEAGNVYKFRIDAVLGTEFHPFTYGIDQFEVTVPDAARPTAVAPPNQTGVACTFDGGVTDLDGSASYDNNPGGSIARYQWYYFEEVDGNPVRRFLSDSTLADVPVALPCGSTTTVYLKVFNQLGLESDPATFNVTVDSDPTPVPIDDVWGPYGIKAGDLAGTAQHPFVAPTGELTLEVVNQREGLPDPAPDRQFVFDRLGNLYFYTWYGSVISLNPDLTTRWESAGLSDFCSENVNIIVGERYLYVTSTGTNDSPMTLIWALRKDTGGPVAGWGDNIYGEDGYTELVDGAFEEAMFNECFRARPMLTLYNDKLYSIGLPMLTENAADPVRVYQIDATTGALDWASVVNVGAINAVPGHLLFVPDLYGSGLHGMFWASRSEGEADGLSDVVGLRIDPTSGATREWGIDAGFADYSRLIYSNATGRDAIYNMTHWNWAGNNLWSLDPFVGGFDLDEDPGTPLTAVGVRGGDNAIGQPQEAAALSFDGVSVWSGGNNGFIYRYTDLGDGTQFDADEFWVAGAENEGRTFGPEMIVVENADGEELLVTVRSENRGTVDPDNPDQDGETRLNNTVVVFNTADFAGIDAALDDGPMYVDNVSVTVIEDGTGSPTNAYFEDFESFPVGAFPPEGNTDWVFEGTAADAGNTQIVDLGGDRGKVLMLDPFGASGNVARVTVTLPDLGGVRYGDLNDVVVNWLQWRDDLTEKVYVGGPFPATASFQGDGTEEEFYPIGKIAGFNTEPEGAQEGGTFADIVADDWQEVELTLSYSLFAGLLATGPVGGPLTGTPTDPFLAPFMDDESVDTDVLTFEVTATLPSGAGGEVEPIAPAAEYVASEIIDPNTFERSWDQPEGLSISPTGDLYFMQFKFFDRRYTRLRLLGDTAPVTICGDANCDGTVDFFDIDPFVTALVSGQAAWEGTFGCDFVLANDINQDGVVDFFDIDPFVGLLVDGGSCGS